MNWREAWQWIRKELASSGLRDTAQEAHALLRSEPGQVSPAILSPLKLVPDEQWHEIQQRVKRRQRREPLQYIRGYAEFYSLSFAVNPDVLIPRPESELLVEQVLRRLPVAPVGRVLDLGTGSGTLAVTLAVQEPYRRYMATDLSEAALKVALQNADRHGVSHRLEFRTGDGFAPTKDERFAFIMSNPPYIETDTLAALEPEVAQWEPRLALDGGTDGLDAYRMIAAGLPEHLVPGGFVALEVGIHQADAVKGLLEAIGVSTVSVRDLSGIPRVVLGQWKAEIAQ